MLITSMCHTYRASARRHDDIVCLAQHCHFCYDCKGTGLAHRGLVEAQHTFVDTHKAEGTQDVQMDEAVKPGYQHEFGLAG